MAYDIGLGNVSQSRIIINMTTTTISTIMDINEQLESRNGKKTSTLSLAMTFTTIYVILFITGLLGNICTCVVIARNQYMHTATNYYLFSLAVSDVLAIIICLPPEVYQIWQAYPWVFGEGFCVFKVYILEMTAVASCLTITAFTVERYIAICRPIQSHIWSSFSRVLKMIIAVWVTAAVCALPYGLHTKVFHTVFIDNGTIPVPESAICNIPREDWSGTMIYILPISTFLLFVGPMTIIIVLYVLIGITLQQSINRSMQLSHNNSHRDSARGKKDSGHSAETSQVHSRRAVIKMLVAVVVAFFLCWCPFHIQRLLTSLITHPNDVVINIQNVLFYITGITYFMSSTINPLLYNVMSKRYRKAFQDTLHCRFSGRFQYDSSFKSTITRRTTAYNPDSPQTGEEFRLV